MARKIFTLYGDYFNCPDIDTHIHSTLYTDILTTENIQQTQTER